MKVTKRFPLGPGRIEGTYWLLRRYPNPSSLPGKVGYEAAVYVDNGYGANGYLRRHGHVEVATPITNTKEVVDAIVDKIDEQLDNLIVSGHINRYIGDFT